MPHGLTEVMETTSNEHHPVCKPRFGVAEAIFDDPYSLHSGQNMLYRHPDLADHAIMLPLLTPGRFLMGWKMTTAAGAKA